MGGKSSKRVGNGRNRAGVTLFNISQPKKGKKNEIPSPRSLRYLIPVSLNCKRDSHVPNGKRDSGTRFTSSKFCEQTSLYKSVPFTEKQPRRPETGMKNGIRISVWNIPSAKKKKFRCNYPECRIIIQLLSNRIFRDFPTRFSGICLFTIVNNRDRRFSLVHQHGVRDVM